MNRGKDARNWHNATEIWYNEWVKQGRTDVGSCCGGKCIRSRITGAKLADSPPVQGNLSASRSVKPALDYLIEQGHAAYFDDGWMD